MTAVIDAILVLEWFLQWVIFSALARWASGRWPDMAFQMESAAMGAYLLFSSRGSMLPPDLRARLRRRYLIIILAMLGIVSAIP